jgi:hypothetical protein
LPEQRYAIIQKFLDQLQTSPRKVFLKPPLKNIFLWIKTIFWLAFFAFIGIIYDFSNLPFLAGHFGTSQEGIIIEKCPLQPTNGRGYPCAIRVKYGNWENEFGVYMDFYNCSVEGQQVKVRYLSSFPEMSALDINKPVGIRLFILISLLLVVNGMSLFVIVGIGFRFIKQKYLLANGVVALGVIDNVSNFGAFYQGIPDPEHPMLTYNFEFNQRLYRGRMWRFDYMDCNLQDEVVVLVDPKNPNRNIPYDEDHFFGAIKS